MPALPRNFVEAEMTAETGTTKTGRADAPERSEVKAKKRSILEACRSQPTRFENVVVMVAQSVQLTMLPRPVPFFRYVRN